MENNEISGHKIKFAIDLLKDIPFVFGDIIGFLFNLHIEESWKYFIELVGILLVIVSFSLFARKIEKTEKCLIATMWMSYVLHFMLVKLHIYAMAHPDQSAGFLVRYSYFYIPLFAVVFPMLLYRFKREYIAENQVGFYNSMIGFIIGVFVLISGGTALNNWTKALDNQFAKIWIENEGWKDTTYLYGVARDGFTYYVSHSDKYQEGYLLNATTEVNNECLPPRFWTWRTNWGGDACKTTIETAENLGYTVKVYMDWGYPGQLTYCYLENN